MSMNKVICKYEHCLNEKQNHKGCLKTASFPDHAICRNAHQMCSPMAPSFSLRYSTVNVEVVLEQCVWEAGCGAGWEVGAQGWVGGTEWGPEWGHEPKVESGGRLWAIERVSMFTNWCGVGLGCWRRHLPLSWRNGWWWSCSGQIRVIIEFCGCLCPSSHHMILICAPHWRQACLWLRAAQRLCHNVQCVDQLMGSTPRPLSWEGCGWQSQQV